MNGFGIPSAIILAALTPSALFQEPACDTSPPMNIPGVNVDFQPDARLLSEGGERACSVKLTYLMSDGTRNVPMAEVYTIIPSRVVIDAKVPGAQRRWGCQDGALVEVGKEATK